MGRLIDEDTLIEELVKLLQIYVKNPYAQGIIIGNIVNLPTAYDVEKVVAELEENKQSEINFRDIVGRDMEKPSHTFSRTIGRIEAFGHAIEIVRKGGAE